MTFTPRILAGIAASAITLTLFAMPDAAPSPEPTCQSEDMVPVHLAERSYGRPAGTFACVHVDHLTYP